MKKDLPVHILNAANGCVYVDRKNKNSRTKAKRKLLMLIKEGHSVLLFPEGTWNLTSSKLILPLNWGMLDLSAISGVPIVPIGLVYSSQKRVVNFGNAISCSCEDVLETERRIETL